MQLPCTKGVAGSFSLTQSPSQYTGLYSFCFIALEHYANMYIVGLWRESARMGLNTASKEDNLRASDECPLTYVSLSRTHKWTSTSLCSRPSRPICARGRPGHPVNPVSFIHRGWVLSMDARLVNGLLIMRPHSVQADTQGCCLVACPQST